MKKKQTNREKIYEYLDQLPAGMVSIPTICKLSTMDEFLKICDEYISERGELNHYSVHLNKNRDTIHKFDLVL